MNAAEYGRTRTYARMPWAGELATGAQRGLGAEFRLLGPDGYTIAVGVAL